MPPKRLILTFTIDSRMPNQCTMRHYLVLNKIKHNITNDLRLIYIVKRFNHDWIGPPNPISNIRPHVFKSLKNSSMLEKTYYSKRKEVFEWNEEFWKTHNTDFAMSKEMFLKNNKQTEESCSNLSADEMSVFYKTFLDKNWTKHLNYNLLWYQKNLNLLCLEFLVFVEKFIRKK